MTSISMAIQPTQQLSVRSLIQGLSSRETASTRNATATSSGSSLGSDPFGLSEASSGDGGSTVSTQDQKGKVARLLDSWVTDGTLTSDEATQIKTALEDVASRGPGQSSSRAGGPPQGGEGPSGGPQGSNQNAQTESDPIGLLVSLLESLSSKQSTTYSGKNSLDFSALFIDQTA